MLVTWLSWQLLEEKVKAGVRQESLPCCWQAGGSPWGRGLFSFSQHGHVRACLETLGMETRGFCPHQLLGDGRVQIGMSCPDTTPSHSWESDAHGLMIPCHLQKPLTGTGNVPSPDSPVCGSILCILGQGWFGLA